MANNRELSQLGSFIVVDDSTRKIGIATTATPFVGIGTTNPQAKLHVVGDAIISGSVTIGGTVSDDNVTNIEDRKSTRLNSSHVSESRMPSSA